MHNKTRSTRRFLDTTVAACAFLLFVAALCGAGPVQAQALPPGSYVETCNVPQIDGATLTAECRDRRGQYHQTFMRNAANCAVGIENIDGVLTCAAWTERGRPELPPGSYLQTCSRVSLADGVLTADCRDRAGNYRATTLMDAFRCPVGIDNIDGALTCSAWAERSRPEPPPGSYLQSCSRVHVADGALMADCRDRAGNYRASTLTDAFRCSVGIDNIDGTLTCPAWREREHIRTELPPGSYLQSCNRSHMSGDQLIAQCKDRRGNFHESFLDHAYACHGIDNIDGTLTCR